MVSTHHIRINSTLACCPFPPFSSSHHPTRVGWCRPFVQTRSTMAISIPLVDSSNGTSARSGFTTQKRPPPTHAHAHAHFRPAHTPPALRKSPPTCTLSLASAHADEPASTLSSLLDFPAPASCVPFPQADLGEDDSGLSSCGDGDGPPPPPRPRARTSHVATPKRAPLPSGTPNTRAPPRTRRPKAKPTSAAASAPTTPAPTSADLRLAALIERTISQRLASLPLRSPSDADPHSSASPPSAAALDAQDALLAARLRALLGRHRTPSPSPSPALSSSPPRALAIPARPPSVGVSLLFSGSAASPPVESAAPSAPPPLPLRATFVLATRAPRERSGSASSGLGSTPPMPMPALVASLMLRRHGHGHGHEGRDRGRERAGAGAGARTNINTGTAGPNWNWNSAGSPSSSSSPSPLRSG
ncbi:hypothetical protein B0H11DRAFT_2275790 [Mycena galericulata]|nr:hypothetical protein B0H11DRAFT_2275790 [Mycena galericulata]